MSDGDAEGNDEELQETSASTAQEYLPQEPLRRNQPSSEAWQSIAHEPDLPQHMIEQETSHSEEPRSSQEEAASSREKKERSASSWRESKTRSSRKVSVPTLKKANPHKIRRRKSSFSRASQQLPKEVERIGSTRSPSLLSVAITSVPSLLSFKVILAKQKPRRASTRETSLDSRRSSGKSCSIQEEEESPSLVSLPYSIDCDDDNPLHDMLRRGDLMAQLTDIPRLEDLPELSLDSSSRLQMPGDAEGLVKPGSLIDSHSIEEKHDKEDEQKDAQSDKTLSFDLSMSCTDKSSLLSLPLLTEKVPVKEEVSSDLDVLDMVKTSSVFGTLLPAGSRLSEASPRVSEVIEHLEQPSKRMRRLLDKEKLYQKLASVHLELEGEMLWNARLHQKTVEYCARRKLFSYFSKTQEFDLPNYECYYSSLARLDRLLLAEKEAIGKARSVSTELAKQLEGERLASERKVQDLESTMRSTLLFNKSHTRIPQILERILADMKSLRDKLSQQRIELGLSQHRLAKMHMKSREIDSLRGGLSVVSYLVQQSDVNMLEADVAESTARMNRLHNRNESRLHALAHLKSKASMTQRRLKDLSTNLRTLQLSEQNYQDLLYQGALKRNRLRRELHRLRSSGTIIQYPALMRDFDEIVAKVEAKRAAVADLQAEYARITQQLANVGSKCSKAAQVEGQDTPPNRSSFLLTGVSVHSLAPVGREQ